jgi:diaminopimelate epimerase
MRFYKYQGTGNDFVLVDRPELPKNFDAEMARRICDRHLGIGADGILVVDRGEGELDGQMTIYNSDGSVPAMCGNGLRCVARHLVQVFGVKKPALRVGTGAGVRLCEPQRSGPHAFRVSVDMGKAAFEAPFLPHAEGDGSVFISLPGGEAVEVTPVSMGNPHAIVRLTPTFDPMREARKKGPLIESHASFPEHTNVEFVIERSTTEYEAAVYERGVGVTLACGTGACAIAAAAVRFWKAPAGKEITIHLPGGDLTVTVEPDLRVTMTGPAEFVFTGDWTA